jgi:hypothetical protein
VRGRGYRRRRGEKRGLVSNLGRGATKASQEWKWEGVRG